jgi:hypothetical protein
MPANLNSRPVWIGLVEVAPVSADDPRWTDNFRSSTGGFTTGVALALDADEFQGQMAKALTEVGGVAIGFEDVETLEARLAGEPPAKQQIELIEELRRTGLPQIGMFHLYGPEEFESHSDWLESAAESDDLTELQREVLRQLAGMLRKVDLPLLEEVDLETPEGGIVVNLTHREEDGIDLEVRVAADDEVVVDYALGHAHFPGGHDLDGLLDFIYAALQGGVMVEVWNSGGSIDRSRTSILMQEGGWRTYSTTASTESATFDDEPSDQRHLGFTQKGKGPDS